MDFNSHKIVSSVINFITYSHEVKAVRARWMLGDRPTLEHVTESITHNNAVYLLNTYHIATWIWVGIVEVASLASYVVSR